MTTAAAREPPKAPVTPKVSPPSEPHTGHSIMSVAACSCTSAASGPIDPAVDAISAMKFALNEKAATGQHDRYDEKSRVHDRRCDRRRCRCAVQPEAHDERYLGR